MPLMLLNVSVLLYNISSYMKNKRSSIDGFIPRRPDTTIGSQHDREKRPEIGLKPVDRSIHTGDITSTDRVGQPRLGKEMNATNDDIFEALNSIDNEPTPEEKTRKRKFRKFNLKKTAKWSGISLAAIVLILGGYLLIKGIIAGNNIFGGNIIDALTKNEPLRQDANGRSNFLVFGTAEDSEGGQHDGGHLTDSIMVVSVNQSKDDAYMLSLPRDLWVRYESPCTVGYEGKLNAVYYCASGDGKDEEAGAKALQKKVGEITGLDIHYYAHLNFTAVVDAVDAVGGVDVTIESDDPRGILDRNFDWRCNYRCYYVNYKNGEKVHLDGEHALALARARNAAGGYGLANGNFDREKNQQKIIKALRDKALSAGTLTNVGAVTGLIDALGNNLRTNVQAKEVRTLMDLASRMENDNIISLSLNEEGSSLVTTGPYNGQSIVRPVLGLMDYSGIHAYVKRSMSSDPFVREEPHVSVMNGSGVAGVATAESNMLSDMGFIIDLVGDAPTGNYDEIEIYQISSDKTATKAKLESKYGVKVKTTPPPMSVVGTTDFLIIVGKSQSSQ